MDVGRAGKRIEGQVILGLELTTVGEFSYAIPFVGTGISATVVSVTTLSILALPLKR